jgi:D-glycero-alpha-D-manno-heptose-7-phosphate kinase
MPDSLPTRIINAVAPIRICDLGGWTDTWFAERGAVLNIGVYPFVQCQMQVTPCRDSRSRLVIHAENYSDRYVIDPARVILDRHPLLEACVEAMRIPPGLDIEVTLYSSIPAGSSTGTSASVAVALIGALDLLAPGRLTLHETAMKAHDVESRRLGLQCGIQDQLCAAFGGISYIRMTKYPDASVSPIQIPNSLWWELESRLSLVYLGRSHKSSDVHKMVIADLERAGAGGARIEALRHPPVAGRDALFAGDLKAFGRAMVANTDAQLDLHAGLASDMHRAVIEIARRHEALGWKINGAGGDGGSVTLLSGASRPGQRRMLREIESLGNGVQVIPIYLSRFGLRVWESDPRAG